MSASAPKISKSSNGNNGKEAAGTEAADKANGSLLSTLDSVAQAAIEKIDKVQCDIDKLNEEASEEILKVEQRFNKLRQPHFKARAELTAQIPSFWLTVFVNHPQLSSLLDSDDENALAYLTNVEVQEFEDIKSGFKIVFHFDATKNPFFENETLTKEFHQSLVGEATSKSTEIKWKPGKNLCAVEASSAKTAQKRAHKESSTFFGWYTGQLNLTAEDYGEVIKEDVWPNPLQYFLAMGEEDDEGDEDEEEGEEEDEDDVDDDEGEDEEEGAEEEDEDDEDDEEDGEE